MQLLTALVVRQRTHLDVKASIHNERGIEMSKKVPTQVSHRKSTDGRFTTEKYAKAHPSTTQREVNKHPERKG